MKTFATTFQAIDKTDGFLKTFVGQNIFAENENKAKEIVAECLPYLSILGEIIKETDNKTGIEINFNQN